MPRRPCLSLDRARVAPVSVPIHASGHNLRVCCLICARVASTAARTPPRGRRAGAGPVVPRGRPPDGEADRGCGGGFEGPDGEGGGGGDALSLGACVPYARARGQFRAVTGPAPGSYGAGTGLPARCWNLTPKPTHKVQRRIKCCTWPRPPPPSHG